MMVQHSTRRVPVVLARLLWTRRTPLVCLPCQTHTQVRQVEKKPLAINTYPSKSPPKKMISRRDKLLQQPWEQLRYAQHREKVMSARPAIDTHTPRAHEHVQRKWKKQQVERERQQQIERENLRLLQKLGDIMRTKRINNLWLEPRPNFLNREKLFPTRPYSSLPEIVTIYGKQPPGPLIYGMLPKPNVVGRCPTCSGNPERTEVAIPEQRTPWAPERKSWNRKTQEVAKQQRCYHCGSVKTSERKFFEEFSYSYSYDE